MNFTTSSVALHLSLDILPDNVESIAVWYSTKGHEGSLTAPPQDVHVVHGSNMISLKVAPPDSSDPCQPYYVWVAGFASNGQRGPYSKRRRVEVCSRTDGMMYKTQYYTVIDDLMSSSLIKSIFDPLERSNSIQQMNSTMLSHWEPLVDWHMAVVIVFAAVRIVFGVMVWRYQGKDKSNEGKVRVCLG